MAAVEEAAQDAVPEDFAGREGNGRGFKGLFRPVSSTPSSTSDEASGDGRSAAGAGVAAGVEPAGFAMAWRCGRASRRSAANARGIKMTRYGNRRELMECVGTLQTGRCRAASNARYGINRLHGPCCPLLQGRAILELLDLYGAGQTSGILAARRETGRESPLHGW